MLKSSSNTNKNLNIIFPLLYNKVFLRYKSLLYAFQLPIKGSYFSITHRPKMSLNFLFFVDKFFKLHVLFNFFYLFNNLVNKRAPIVTGFFRVMDLVGLGFRITRITKSIFFFDIGYSTGIYFFVPTNAEVFYSPSTKKLVIFSADIQIVSSIVSSLFLLRGPHTYKVRGFIDARAIVRLRTGKQR